MNSSAAENPAVARSARVLDRVVLTLLAGLLAYHLVACLTTQKAVGWDASMGFLTLQSSLEHGEFNRFRHPDPANLTRDRGEYVAWWTPGQYLIPHWIARPLGTDVGFALRLLTAFCALAGVAGYAWLFARLGFSRGVIALALLVLCSQEYYLKDARVYLGGESLLFAAAPYLALVALAGGEKFLRRGLCVALVSFVALFLKASAGTIFLALMTFLFWEALREPARNEAKTRLSVAELTGLGVLSLVFVVAAREIYLTPGIAIGTTPHPWRSFPFERLPGVAVALAGPLSGAFSWMDALSRPLFFVPVALIAAGIFWVLGTGRGGATGPEYRRLLLAYVAVCFVFFSYAYLRGFEISYESRHFRFAGLLLLPGLIHLLMNSRFRLTLTGLLLVACGASVAISHQALQVHRATEDSRSRWGIRQPVSNDSLAGLHAADARDVTPATIVFNGFGACPSLLLEFAHGRKLPDDNLAAFGFDVTPRHRSGDSLPWYRNEASDLVLIVSKNQRWYFGPSVEEIAATFERRLRVSPRFENNELIVYRGSAR